MTRCLTACLVALGMSANAAPLFRATFEPGLPGWKVSNSENRLMLQVKDYEGEQALVVTRSPTAPKGDTAWGLVGPTLPVKAGERLRVVVRARGRGDARLAFPLGFNGQFLSALQWLDAAGKPVGPRLGFGYDVSTVEWRTRRYAGVVPSGAVSARVLVGVDNPDLGAGDVLAISSVVVERDEPPASAAHRTSLRDDGVVLCDGEPFFPIGLYGIKKTAVNGMSYEKALAGVKSAGFNTVQTYFATTPETLSEFLDQADRLGLKAFVASQPRIDGPTEASANVSANRNRPSVLGWYLADDASGHHAPDQLFYRRRFVRYSDTDHLTLQTDTPVIAGQNRYAPYVGSTEVFLPQIYCFGKPETDANGVAFVVRDMLAVREAIEEAGSPVRSVWPVLQHFNGWGWNRFPTYAELRASVYAALAHGARGILLYTYCGADEKNLGVASSPERWAEAAEIAGELKALAPDLVCRDAKRKPTVTVLDGPQADALGAPSVSVLLKASEVPLLLAVNAANAPVRIRFGLACKAEEIFEKRTLSSTDGLVDTFAPLAVHVYRLKR